MLTKFNHQYSQVILILQSIIFNYYEIVAPTAFTAFAASAPLPNFPFIAVIIFGATKTANTKRSNTPKFRALSIPILSKLVSLLFKINVTDVTCGFRAYKLDLIKRARFEINQKWLYGYSFEPYLYSNVFLDKNVTKKEIPVKMSYPLEKNIKYTKIKPLLNYPGLVMPYIIGKYLFKGFNMALVLKA